MGTVTVIELMAICFTIVAVWLTLLEILDVLRGIQRAIGVCIYVSGTYSRRTRSVHRTKECLRAAAVSGSAGQPRGGMMANDWETECPRSNDKQHCDCWYDGKPCCRCGEAMNFGQALEALKNDTSAKVQRSGWNGKGMWLGLQVPDANSKMGMPYIYLSTVDGKLVPWNPNNIDMLAEDWQIAEE